MMLAKLPEFFLVLSFVIVQIAVKPAASNLSYENKNVIKIKQDPTRFQVASGFRNKKHIYATRFYTNATTQIKQDTTRFPVASRYQNKKHNYATRYYTTNETTPIYYNKINSYISRTPLGTGGNYSQDKYKIVHNNEKAIPKTSQSKKWQVGRVSRKQYEIINMLWRKTKIFVDVEPTTANYYFRRNNETARMISQPFIRLSSRSTSPSSTPSYIEFYYLDETDERVKEFTTQKHIQIPAIKQPQLRNHGNHKFVLSGSPMFSFRIHDSNNIRSQLTTRFKQLTNKTRRRKSRTHVSALTGIFDPLNSLTPSYKSSTRMQENKFVTTSTASSISEQRSIQNITSTISTTEYFNDNETCPTTQTFTIINDTTETENKISDKGNMTQKQKSTTVYDKIKFFEMYDKHTPLPYYDEKGRLYDTENVDIFIRGNELYNNERKVLLEHVDQNISNHSIPHKVKHAKKHIISAYKTDSNIKQDMSEQDNKTLVIGLKTTVKPTTLSVPNTTNVTKQSTMKLVQFVSKVLPLHDYGESKHVKWSQYPFAAAYIYEPSQVHCDAAGISPHWLITSGSCLSRHHKNPGGEGRSAFVAYCGDSWWNPERVAYVKYSVVHPRFHPRDKTRRHLYNIGLIQVVNSMASACTGWSSISLMSHQIVAEGGTTANAIGWGLDRFDVRYSSNDLPKSLLRSYESQVFSHSCPGNVGYGKAKRLDEEGGIKNVYCLALPPYLGETGDPIHGGLLLVGGKLVALYLQEERRPWGDQSAQYTGTWRLVPWILDVARENDFDTFTLDI